MDLWGLDVREGGFYYAGHPGVWEAAGAIVSVDGSIPFFFLLYFNSSWFFCFGKGGLGDSKSSAFL